jgi:hypothetical protein
MLFDTANLAYWIFLGIGVFLFLLVIVSGGGEDQDIETDLDTDIDVDVDIDVDAELDAEADLETEADTDTDTDVNFLSFLSWLGVGKTPLLILLAIDFSSWGVSGWFLNVVIGETIGKIPEGIIASLIFLASLAFSLWLGRLLSRPIGKIFTNFGEDASGERLIGRMGKVASKQVPYLVEGKIAQADVVDNASNLVTVEVCLPDWAKVIPYRGQEILIIDRYKHGYIVIAKDSSDEDKWLNSSKN